MPDYGLVSRSINNLADRIGGLSAQRNAHDERMMDYGLAEANLGLREREMQGQQNVELAKAKRDQWLNEEVTGRQAIMTHPKMTDEQKKAFITNLEKSTDPEFAKYILDGAIYKRGKWAEAARNAISAHQERTQKAQLEQQKLGIQKDRNAILRSGGAKDNRSTMQKEVEYIAQTNGISPQQALVQWQKSKSLPERIRLFSEEVKALNDDITLFGEEGSKIKAQKIQELRDLYGVQDLPGDTPQSTPALPPGFVMD